MSGNTTPGKDPETMSYSKASMQATNKYMKNNLDVIRFSVPKEKKDQRPTKQEITEHAEKYGYSSTQQFILSAINKQMMIDKKEAAFIDLTDC